MPPLARQPRNRQALYAIYRQPRCARCLPAAMRGLRIVRIISSLICDGGAFPSGPALSAGKDPFPGGESRSSGIPGAVARNGAPLSSPRLRQTSPAGLVFSQSRSANAEVEAMTAMMHRAALTAVNLSHESYQSPRLAEAIRGGNRGIAGSDAGEVRRSDSRTTYTAQGR